jgi:phenylacetaldehyde dehydrogenase
VVAGITPPNYPLTMPLYKAVPALVTGNTVIMKPSEDTSLVALRLGEIFCKASLPDGVFNVVTGLGETAGAALANHDDVDKITFTGSTEVGRPLVRASAPNLKKVSLELGGKPPNIVFADADLEAALKGVFMGIFFCQGEICSTGSRLFVEGASTRNSSHEQSGWGPRERAVRARPVHADQIGHHQLYVITIDFPRRAKYRDLVSDLDHLL